MCVFVATSPEVMHFGFGYNSLIATLHIGYFVTQVNKFIFLLIFLVGAFISSSVVLGVLG